MMWLIQPFLEHQFMREAWLMAAMLATSSVPLGVWFILCRMGLLGDAMSHAILPGVAVAYLWFGMSIWAMSLLGLLAGLCVALLVGVLPQRGDAHLTLLYLVALALGVVLMSQSGNSMDLSHVLFGQILAVDPDVWWIVLVALILTLSTLCMFHRTLLLVTIDPLWARGHGFFPSWYNALLISLFVINLVAGIQVMGTLMMLGLTMLPAIAAMFFARSVASMMIYGVLFAYVGIAGGLLVSFYWDTLPGPSIVLMLGLPCLCVFAFSRRNSLNF